MKYVSTNLINGATITVSTEDNTYPKANLYNQRPGKPFKMTADNGIIIIDFGEAKTFDTVALLNNNFDDVVVKNTTITLEATDSWSSPAFSTEIAPQNPTACKCFTAQSYQYVRIVIANNTDNVRIGELIIGSSVSFSQQYKYGYKEKYDYRNLNLETDYGQLWSYNLFNRRFWDLHFSNRDDTTKSEVKTLLDAVKGSNIPFLYIPELNDVVDGNNILTNPDFTTNTDGWAVTGSALLASVAGGQSGNCLRVTENGEDYPSAYQYQNWEVGEFFSLKWYAKEGTESSVIIRVRNSTDGGAGIASYETTGSWVQKKGCVSVTKVSSYFMFRVATTSGSGLNAYFDTAEVYRIGHNEAFYVNMQDSLDITIDYNANSWKLNLIEVPTGKVV